MTAVTVADVLAHARQHEKMIADFFKAVAEQSSREGVKLLADYFGHHRSHLSKVLLELPKEEYNQVLSAPIRYEPQGEKRCMLRKLVVTPDVTAKEILDAVVQLDECMINVYRQVLQQEETSKKVQEFIESLIHSKQRDEIELKKIIAMDYF